jgi:hypothetical protein
MSRGVFLLGVGIVLLAGAFLLTDRLLFTPGVTEANVRRIRPGMSVQQVEGLLGGPAKSTRRNGCSGRGPLPWWGCWVGSEGFATVHFDPHGRAVDGRFDWNQPRPPGPLDQLLSGLGLR